MRVGRWSILTAMAVLGASIMLGACGGGDDNGGGGGGGASLSIGLLLPESKTPRYEFQDKPQSSRGSRRSAPAAASSTRTPIRIPTPNSSRRRLP
jgi:D-xylose transport system substrate-binding protein